VNELDVMIGTLRPEVQVSYQSYKAEALLLKLSQDERLQEITDKIHSGKAQSMAPLIWTVRRPLDPLQNVNGDNAAVDR
ncbi:hypothetical protein TELCIR_20882, partial [Teladorsagia circumcincta]